MPNHAGDSQDPHSKADEWYADGLRFACTQCGNCCTGPSGYVWFTPEEGRAMAASIGVDEATFYQQYARRIRNRWSLAEHVTPFGYDCVFLDRDSIPGKALCRVYKARPAQCQTWPFWPENIATPRHWARAKKATPCPGMESGRLIRVEEIRIQRDRTPE